MTDISKDFNIWTKDIRAATILHSLPTPVFIADQQMRICYFNLAAEQITGFKSREAVGMYCKDVLKSGICETECAVKQALDTDKNIYNIETTIVNATGQTIPALVSASLIKDITGKIFGYLYSFRDISVLKKIMSDLETSRAELTERNIELDRTLEELKLTHMQFLHAQKMEAVGRLAGGIAHDFNNILTAIIGFGSLLKKEEKDEHLGGYINQILTSSERAANLTQTLLTFSRKQTISPKPVNLNEIIRRLEKVLLRLIGENIELSVVLADKDLTIMADSGQIDQVLMNLATNAQDAMPAGGSLTIKTECAHLDYEFIRRHGLDIPGEYALLSIKDTGVGMDEKTKERIFEPFFTTKETGKGTGLGLATAYGIVKQHKGYIHVYSEPDKGSIFKIYLLLHKSSAEKEKEKISSVIEKGTETVLLVEDDVQVRELIREILTRFGYTVLEAKDGEEAIQIFYENKEKIELLILDVIMPKRNGKEVFDEIKKVRPGLEAIFMSGYDANILYGKNMAQEGFEFIPKPILPDELLRKVRILLDKRI